MSILITAFFTVLILLAVSLGGFILRKKNMVGDGCIPGLSKVLLYICQPCLAIYTFSEVQYSWQLVKNLLIFAGLLAVVYVAVLGGSFLVLRKKYSSAIYRILTIATAFSNCAFFGIPVIEALMPEVAGEVIIYTTVFGLIMNILGWTVGSAIIANDIKYMSPKKIILNPATVGTFIAIVIFVFGITFPPELSSIVATTGKSCTPLSMIIIGMRLATVEFKKMFTDIRIYLTLAVKQIVMPVIVFLLVFSLDMIDLNLRKTLFITCACPAASVVLNFAEIVGEGQKEAANLVLLSTISSIITLPVAMLLLPLI